MLNGDPATQSLNAFKIALAYGFSMIDKPSELVDGMVTVYTFEDIQKAPFP